MWRRGIRAYEIAISGNTIMTYRKTRLGRRVPVITSGRKNNLIESTPMSGRSSLQYGEVEQTYTLDYEMKMKSEMTRLIWKHQVCPNPCI